MTGGIKARPQNIPTYPNLVPSMKTKEKKPKQKTEDIMSQTAQRGILIESDILRQSGQQDILYSALVKPNKDKTEISAET